jgi:hypothetical protein
MKLQHELGQGKVNDPPPNCELAAADGGLITIQSNEIVMETSPAQTYTIVGVLPLLPMRPFANGYKWASTQKLKNTPPRSLLH